MVWVCFDIIFRVKNEEWIQASEGKEHDKPSKKMDLKAKKVYLKYPRKEIESPVDSMSPSIQTNRMSRNKEHDLD